MAQETPEVVLKGNWAIIWQAIGLFLGGAWVGISILKGQNPITVLTSAIRGIFKNAELTRTLRISYKNASPAKQQALKQLIALADPLSPVIPGTLDSETLDWLRDIANETGLNEPQG